MTTTFKTATDFRKSLEARLKSIAEETNQDLQRVRRKVAFERLLSRIFHEDTGSFVLKGGYAMELRFSSARATKDIDLTCLRRIDDHDSTIEAIIFRELRQLIRIDLEDYFTFQLGQAKKDLDNAPFGGSRYSVASFVDNRLFVQFQLDVGGDVIVGETDLIDGVDWLNYCGIGAPKLRMISIEQQLPEKFHAFSLPREQKTNSRVKDLLDMLLLIEYRKVDISKFEKTVKKVFNTRNTHAIPESLKEPPIEWEVLYQKLADECGIRSTMSEAYNKLNQFFQKQVKKNLKRIPSTSP